MQQVRDIKTLDIHALEETIDRYPWFAAARAEYFSRMVAMDREYIRPAARKTGLYVPDRCLLYDTVILGHTREQKPLRKRTGLRADVRPEEDHRDDAPLEQPVVQPEIKPAEKPAETPRRRVPGGDYFSRQDFEELAESGQSYTDLRFTPKSNLSSSLDRAAGILSSEIRPQVPDTDEVCTETLAGIYYSQGFYRRAIDIYKKLILFYPEKNTYFAALIERCKEKTKK
ncbi:MAG: hypothetical protein IKX60_05000 [Bacteroidales bacterium]|nr:hypothetical protein [Bacteroidales bacterium]